MITSISILTIVFGTIAFALLYLISLQPESLSKRITANGYKICGSLRIVAIIFEVITIIGYILFISGNQLNFQILQNNKWIIIALGIIITIISIIIMIIGMISAGKESAVPNKKTKLYGGIYNYMRHPQTLGEMITWLGISLILNSFSLLIYSLIMIPLFIGFTVIEDNDLAIRFGNEYIKYTKKVGIFWKKIVGS